MKLSSIKKCLITIMVIKKPLNMQSRARNSISKLQIEFLSEEKETKWMEEGERKIYL